eukprot:1833001-Rhodomonas_salina.1
MLLLYAVPTPLRVDPTVCRYAPLLCCECMTLLYALTLCSYDMFLRLRMDDRAPPTPSTELGYVATMHAVLRSGMLLPVGGPHVQKMLAAA